MTCAGGEQPAYVRKQNSRITWYTHTLARSYILINKDQFGELQDQGKVDDMQQSSEFEVYT